MRERVKICVWRKDNLLATSRAGAAHLGAVPRLGERVDLRAFGGDGVVRVKDVLWRWLPDTTEVDLEVEYV